MDKGASRTIPARPEGARERLGVTPGKMALVGALAVMLVGVLYYQYGQYAASGSTEAAASADAEPGQRPRTAGRSAQSAARQPIEERSEVNEGLSSGETINQKLWQAPDLAGVIQYDPFALPASFPQTVRDALASASGASTAGEAGATTESQLASLVEELQTQLEELRQRGVTVIVKHRDEYAAMIGDRKVRVGDEINGFTVTAIEPGGVHVEYVERKIQE